MSKFRVITQEEFIERNDMMDAYLVSTAHNGFYVKAFDKHGEVRAALRHYHPQNKLHPEV